MSEPLGWPGEREKRCAEGMGWQFAPYEIAPGITITVCRSKAGTGPALFYWPPTDRELAGWKYVPPSEEFCRSSLPLRKAEEKPRLPIYTTGYGNRRVEDLFESLRSLNGYLIDIRDWPHSRLRPEFDQDALVQRFQRRYLHMPTLGNTARGMGGIHIPRLQEGIAHVEALIQAGRGPLVLLCACGKPDHCHRTVIAEALTHRGHLVMEMEWIKHENRNEESRTAVVSSRA